MKEDELLAAFDRVRVWQRGEQRAVHKPLLVLLALGRLSRGEPTSAKWSAIEGEMRTLLERFGPAGAAASRHYPFWHLRTDGLWVLDGPRAILERPPAATPTLTELKMGGVSGGFAPPVLEALAREPRLVAILARRIVEAHFPESLQQDVLDAVGLESGETTLAPAPGRPRRDPAFRERVLRAYQYRCCVCGHDLRLAHQIVGLEAAHIQWVQAKGPDIEPNGFALCSLHHKLFDLGAFTVLPGNCTLVVSEQLNGSNEPRERILTYHGAAIVMPQRAAYQPGAKYLEWHAKEVFKGPGRKA